MPETLQCAAPWQHALAAFLRAPHWDPALLSAVLPHLNAAAPMTSTQQSRLAVYRNNVWHSLTQALAAQYPALQRQVGAAVFSVLAQRYIATHLPTQPTLTLFGDRLAAHLAAHPINDTHPWLADLACLEFAAQRALHAADIEPVALTALLAIDPNCLPDCRLTLHPSVTLLHSCWPLQALLDAEQPVTDATPSPPTPWLVHRQAASVQIVHLQPAAGALLQTLGENLPLHRAWEITQQRCGLPDEELTPLLTYLLQRQLFVAFTAPAEHHCPGDPAL